MTKPLIGIGADVTSGLNTADRERAFSYLTYANAVRQAGAIPLLIPPQPENIDELIGVLDGVLLAGGADCDPSVYGEEAHPTISVMDRRRQSNELALAKATRLGGVPTLGICLGLQMMTVAAGGTLVQDIESEIKTDIQHASAPTDRVRHDIAITSGSRLASIISDASLSVNSSHHQSVRTAGSGLTVSAVAPDGVVEAVEDPDHPFYVGVQWHPEDMQEEGSALSLFTAFIKAASTRAQSR
ncbi:MAG TPA: gamma-glutamyl-gamma-aminobutyrate hydrolase family protein [Thermoanaerobaculia bacterium]|nr:gamma-glutamyl-gamma-aminobutyrate hydrolase family protein [Thermoanaerobaculia bacterium]